ncbi:MAG: hypothetical protein VB108_08085 [Anaerolineaceae bacterium]|nr:hypothetical protein [Anaerolineaceae bacterium]
MTIAIFNGLVFDEYDQPLEVAYLGIEPYYVIDDKGFHRHIPAAEVDRQIFEQMTSQVKGNEDMLSEQAAKMMGQEDPFTIAVIRSQLCNQEKQFADMQNQGLPEDLRSYLGMVGFKAVVDFHGELKQLNQPSISEEGED